MNWLTSKTAAIGAVCLAFVGLQGYGFVSMRSALEDRMGSIEREVQTARSQDNSKMTQLASDLDVVTNRMGITVTELQQARSLAEQLKQEHAKTAQRLRSELAAKADAKLVSQVREEATNKLQEVQQDTTNKFGVVNGEVQTVKTDLDATKQDLAASRKDLSELGTVVARNGTELAELRKKGERDYFEFDMRKGAFERIADVQVQLKKADTKRKKFTVVVMADDSRIEKKDRNANEPVTFLAGRERPRYEFVVNYVDKDRIRGYLSTPKDKVLSAEGPSFRRQ